MDPALLALRRARAIAALVPLFLASGATSLVYQTLWVRHLHLVVGTSQLAVSIVLAAFMAGLAAGGFLAGRVADRIARPLVAYGLLEAFIGLYALIFPTLVHQVEPIYTGFWRAAQPTPALFAGFQFLLLGALLLLPTTAMGATLPLLARFAATDPRESGDRVGRLYGANTIGAVVGTALAGFLLLPQLGLSATNLLAATSNALLAAAAIWLGMRVAEMPASAQPPGGKPVDARPGLVALTAVAAIAGLTGLLYEVSWFRLLVLVLGGSTYAFTVMLLAFLLGIGAGGWAAGPIADRTFGRGGVRRVLLVLAGIQVSIGVLAWLTMWLYGELPFAFVALYNQVEDAPGLLWPAKLLLCLLVMLPPTLLMGATFTFLVRAAAGDSAELGGHVGRLYGWNTLGAIIGAAAGGLFLLPRLHIQGTVLLALCLNLLAGWLAGVGAEKQPSRPAPKPRWHLLVGWALAAGWLAVLGWYRAPPWNALLMTAGMYKYVSDLEPEERNRAGILDFAVTPYDLLFYEEGLSSVVTVARSKTTGNIWLANNGKVDASTGVDMPTQLLVAHLPFAFLPDAKNVAVIGLASGITAGAVVRHAGLEHIDIIELEPAIVTASHFFDEHNGRPLEDPRVRLLTNDGRNQLVLTPDGAYDIMVSEPSNPWLTGVSNLFTKEFFELGKRKLAPGGVWGQWVQMYGMDIEDLRTLLATFASVYPHVQLFSTIEDADLVLVGSDAPLPLEPERLGITLAEPAVAAELALIDVKSVEDILVRWQLDRPMIERFAVGATLNTDDNMRIEYSAPLHLHEDTANENFLALLTRSGARDVVPVDEHGDFDELVALARAYDRREDWVRALLVLKLAEKVRPGQDIVEVLYLDYQRKLVNRLEDAD